MKHIKKFNEGENNGDYLDTIYNRMGPVPRLELRDKVSAMIHDGSLKYLYTTGGIKPGFKTPGAQYFVNFVSEEDPTVVGKSIYQSFGDDGNTLWREVLRASRWDIAEELIRRGMTPTNVNYIKRGLNLDGKTDFAKRCIEYLSDYE